MKNCVFVILALTKCSYQSQFMDECTRKNLAKIPKSQSFESDIEELKLLIE